ncbi:hypothetical protein A2U01_0096385, partial [Trifolium medium]|nr:hypothetical protein [Trifolium medium]
MLMFWLGWFLFWARTTTKFEDGPWFVAQGGSGGGGCCRCWVIRSGNKDVLG